MVVLVIDVERGCHLSLSSVVTGAVDGGVGMVILRDRNSSTDAVLQRARDIREWVPTSVPFLINSRLDIARAVGADGVHLPEHGLSVSEVREFLPQHSLVGRSVHSRDTAISSVSEGVDYLLVGTMFVTSSKPGRIPEGPDSLRTIHSQVTAPLVGIGGIHVGNAGLVMQAGARGVAVVTAITHATQPEKVTQQLVQVVHRYA